MEREELDFEDTYRGFKLQGHYLGRLQTGERGKGYRVDALKEDCSFSVIGIVYAKDEKGYRSEVEEDQQMIREQTRDQTIARVKERIDEDRHENEGDYGFTVNLSPKSEI